MGEDSQIRWQAEEQLLYGLGRGITNGARDAIENHWQSLAIGLGTAVLGYEFAALSKIGAFGTKALGTAMNYGLAIDGLGWMSRAGSAAYDTWKDPSRVDQHMKEVEDVGNSMFNTAALFGVGYAGVGLAKFKTPLDYRANIRNAFDNIAPGYVPRLQSGGFLGPKPIFEDANSPLGKFYTEHSPAVAQVSSPNWNGTGFYADVKNGAGYWLTNWHVVEGAESLSIKSGGRSLKGIVVGGDPKADIGVVATEIVPGLSPVKLAQSGGLPAQTDAIAITHARSSPVSMLSEGQSSRFVVPEASVDTIAVNPLTGGPRFEKSRSNLYISQNHIGERILPAASGAPLFDKSNGEVIAIVSGSRANGGLAIGVEHASPVLNVVTADASLLTSGKALEVSTRIHAPNATKKSILGEPVTITGVKQVNQNDILTAPVDSSEFGSARQFQPNAMQAAKIAGTMEFFLTAKRAEKEMNENFARRQPERG